VGFLQEANQQDVSSDPTYRFTQEAVRTALDMIMMQPPMVIDYPHTLNFISDIHEKQSGAWDETLQEGEYQLEYFRPVLYRNYHAQDVITSALVGNRPKDSRE
jgi:transglutaminase/protease-like cytokinesis protein 3